MYLSPKWYVWFALAFSWLAFFLSQLFSTWLEEVAQYLHLTDQLSLFNTSGLVQAPTMLGIVVACFWLLDNCLWKIFPLKYLFNIPNINGRYKGSLTSTFTCNNQENGTYDIIIEMQQNLRGTKVRLYTATSSSFSLVEKLEKNEHGAYELSYVYQNQTAALDVTNRDMRDHRGAAFLKIFDSGTCLEGNYFNNPRDRGRYGNLKVKRVSFALQGRFEGE